MSEYVPTTEQVRTVYAARDLDTMRNRMDAFNRWLEAERERVRQEERERALPHRDELADLVLAATIPYRGAGGQTTPYVLPVHYAIADAVLARITRGDR